MELEHGLTVAELMRGLGLAAALAAIVALVLVEFVYRPRLQRATYHWLLLIALFVLPSIALLGTTTTLFEETKTVASCASCHVMQPFVSDMVNPASETLAARHYRNKWIPNQQCYTCHMTYGVHGTLEAKKAGLRHWALYVTHKWKEPIQHRGTYPNANCLFCHGGTPTFATVDMHKASFTELVVDQMACTDCHGQAHPAPEERSPGVTDE